MPIVGLLLLLYFFFFPKQVLAATVVINEFSPASSPEWVELYNPSDQEVALKDLVIFFDANPTTSQKLVFCDQDKIAPQSFRLINPISSSSWLANAGDTIILKQGDDIIDSVAYGSGQTLKAPTATQSAVRSADNSFLVTNSPTPQGEVAVFTCPEPAANVSQSVITAPTPKVEWGLDNDLYVGRDFKTTKLELSNFDANTEYFLKIRGGTEEGKLTKFQTKNGGAYLSDGESWSKFPLIKTDENAKWSGEIQGLLSENKPEGKYKILIRVRKKDAESFYESEVKEVNFSKLVEEEPAVEAVITKPASDNVGLVLGASNSAENIASEPAILLEATSDAKTVKESSSKLPLVFGIFGLGFFLAGAAIYLKKYIIERREII